VQIVTEQQSAALSTLSAQVLLSLQKADEAKFECARLANAPKQAPAVVAEPVARHADVDVDAIIASATRAATAAVERTLGATFDARMQRFNDRVIELEAQVSKQASTERREWETKFALLAETVHQVRRACCMQLCRVA
jgi:hypothetical protein